MVNILKRDVEVLGIYIKKAFSDQFYPYDVICDIFPHFIMCVYWILTDVPAIWHGWQWNRGSQHHADDHKVHEWSECDGRARTKLQDAPGLLTHTRFISLPVVLQFITLMLKKLEIFIEVLKKLDYLSGALFLAKFCCFIPTEPKNLIVKNLFLYYPCIHQFRNCKSCKISKIKFIYLEIKVQKIYSCRKKSNLYSVV